VLGHRRIAGAAVGFDSRNLYLLSLDPLRDGYSGAQTAAFYQKLLDRVKQLRAIAAVSLADTTPMQMIGKPGVTFAVDSVKGERVLHNARLYTVGKDYLDTLGLPILQGRGFRSGDEAADSIAAIVNERVVRDCWSGANPLGRRLEIGGAEAPTFQVTAQKTGGRPRLTGKTRVVEIVGVTRNVRDGVDMASKELPPMIYLPLRPDDYTHPSLYGITLVARATPGVDAMGAVRGEISAMDSNLTPYRARTMTEQIEEMLFTVRAALWTYGSIGVFGLILVSVGLAGVTAYSVTQRRREIGIRMALGARRGDVLALVMREGALLIAVGTVFGLAGARAGTHVLAGFMETIARTAGTSTSDPMLLVGAPLLLAVLALVACYLPARKSMRVDPVVALRSE
jgi:putative ABC transport system permease protein